MSRSAIPREVARDILIEAGHRCAVCGVPNPLERAHIVPWSKTRSHERENLICLCASCHQRADLECWGEKTLRSYKERPWVARHLSLDAGPRKTAQVEIVINCEFEDFDEKTEAHLLHALAGFLRIAPESVRVIKKEEGSVRLWLELPADAAADLMREKERLEEHLPFEVIGLSEIDPQLADSAVGERESISETVERHEEHFGEIYRKHYSAVYGFFRKRGIAAVEAEDLTQEVFLRAYRNLGTFKKDRVFSSWLYGISRSIYRQHLRSTEEPTVQDYGSSASRTVAIEVPERAEPSFSKGPLSKSLKAERRLLLAAALEQLPDQMRQCVQLRVDREFKYREIADTMKISIETVKSHLYQARRRLGGIVTEELRELEKVN